MIPAAVDWLGALASWSLRTSFAASLLICVILLLRSVARGRISAQWRSALWLLVVLRLAVPWTPESRFSVLNLVPASLSQLTTGHAAPQAAPALIPALAPSGAVEGSRQTAGRTRAALLVAIWCAGAALLASLLLLQTLATLRAYRRRRPVTDKTTLDLMEDCKAQLGVGAYLPVIETPHIRVPALFGWIRPQLLLPEGMLAALSHTQLRHVFLHELAHLKRHDVAFNWSMAAVQVLHWFNPLVWFAFREARADLEHACDELVLQCLPDGGPKQYGNTILDLFSAGKGRLPAFAALAEDATQVKRRIRMIAAFRQARPLSHLASAAIMLALAAAFFLQARTAGQAASPPAARAQDNASSQVAASTAGQPPADAAMEAAKKWMAVSDSGNCEGNWDQMHFVARQMISRKAWADGCAALHRLEDGERGKVTTRSIASVEVLASLPMGLGPGISVRFASRYAKGQFAGPKLLFAKDRDGEWRLVRFDRE
jgi:bla regulator protein blaR1